MLRDHERVTLRASGFVACALTADRLRSWFGCGSASGIQARPSHQSPSRISIKHDTRHDTRQRSRRVTTIDDAGTRRDRTLVVAACTFRSVFTLLPVSYILGVCRFVRTPRADARPHLRGRVRGGSHVHVPPPSRCRARLAVKPRGSPALARRSAARRASAEPGASTRPSRGGWRLVTGVVAWGFTWGSSSVSLLYLVSKDRRICKAICT